MNCPHTDRGYNEKHDAYYCNSCGKWLEVRCGDDECHYCRRRPRKPEVSEIADESAERYLTLGELIR